MPHSADVLMESCVHLHYCIRQIMRLSLSKITQKLMDDFFCKILESGRRWNMKQSVTVSFGGGLSGSRNFFIFCNIILITSYQQLTREFVSG